MKKVLFLTNIPSPYRVEFFNGLSKYCDLTVLYQKAKSDERDNKWVAKSTQNYNSIILHGKSINTDSALCLEVIKYLKKDQYDHIIICGVASPTEMLAMLYCQAKHIPYSVEGDGAFFSSGNIIKTGLKKKLLSHCNLALATCHEHVKYYLGHGVAPEKIRKYPFSSIHDKDIKIITLQEKEKCKKNLGIKEDYVILAVGQFIHRKGFDLLLRAASSFDRNVGFYLVGGNCTDEYKSILKNEVPYNIHFIEFLSKEELADFYKSADLFVFPTREDIWGLVVNEAMSYGLPVITTKRCNAGLELIKNGKNGYLIDTDNLNELVLAIQKSMNYKFDEKYIYETIHKYTIDTMIEAHKKILKL